MMMNHTTFVAKVTSLIHGIEKEAMRAKYISMYNENLN